MKHQIVNNKNELPSGIGQPATRALIAAGLTKINDFTKFSEKELSKLHGVGPKAIRMIKDELHRQGLDFANPYESGQVSEVTNEKLPKRKLEK